MPDAEHGIYFAAVVGSFPAIPTGAIMKEQIKNLLEHTPIVNSFYGLVRERRNRRGFQRWTEEDQGRFDFYKQFVKPGDVVFDVGANLGNRTKIFLKLGATVIGFEPQQKCADYLQSVLKGERGFTLVRKALGDKPGKGEMLVSNAHVLSTLSPEWVDATKESGRFGKYEWSGRQPVEITTLDESIRKFGSPSFIKIDVEGFEYQVLSGLSQAVPGMSIEFAGEQIEKTYRCMDHMNSLGETSFQISCGESMEFTLPAWVPLSEAKEALARLIEDDKLAWGDVYIRQVR